MPTPREQARSRTMADITRIGREHLVTYGAAGLSLRAVARDLGVVSSAVYRYVASRDELLTLLVVDAYAELGEAVSLAEAATAQPRDDFAARWRALAGTVRDWALAEPSRYALVFGTPVPGYHAPPEATSEAGTRVITALLCLAAEAEAAGACPVVPPAGVPDSVRGDAERIRGQYGLALSDAMLTATVLAWVALFGAVSFEVFGQYGPETFAEPAAMFAALIDLVSVVLGLPGVA